MVNSRSAAVMQAKHKNTGADVAIKVIYKQNENIEFAQSQVALSMAVHSKGIVKHVEIIEDSEYFYLVTSLMNCTDL